MHLLQIVDPVSNNIRPQIYQYKEYSLALLSGDDEEAGSGPGRLFRRACIHDTSHQQVPKHQDHPAPGPALKRHTTLPLSPAE